MYLTVILAACFAVSYVLLVLVAQTWLQALALAILLGLSAAGVGFNIQHIALPGEGSGRIENAWAIHQVETTVDSGRGSRVVAWLLGGLNFQIEHHLFPSISHVNYPAISRLVKETCRDFGVKYAEYNSFRAAMASHFRWLRRMGR